MATTNNNNTIDEDNSNTPTLAQMTILPNNDHQLQPWLTPLPASSSSSSSASSYSSSSSSSSSLSSPSSSSSSSPSYQPLEPDTISSSSSLCLPQPSNILLPKTTTQASFRLPGPALSHPFLNLSSAISLNPPPNFATVAPGLFRSSFPKPEHFEFLAKLKLRTILTLVQEPYPTELVKHYENNGIKLIQFAIPGNKIRLALRQVLDVRNHPMLIHCNKGKHRTGCLVGCLRKLQHWSSTAIFDEYRRYAFPKSRNMDQQFIELFDHSPVWEEVEPDFAPEWLDLSM
ncbi:hypothetical protein H4Q26_001368 [Puccinia striiformis f. sp. tritici PST-130]|nr:hypothetical protein H4Q26_001368 [Puccinia striiformis f. sp. tritici PST-130]